MTTHGVVGSWKYCPKCKPKATATQKQGDQCNNFLINGTPVMKVTRDKNASLNKVQQNINICSFNRLTGLLRPTYLCREPK